MARLGEAQARNAPVGRVCHALHKALFLQHGNTLAQRGQALMHRGRQLRQRNRVRGLPFTGGLPAAPGPPVGCAACCCLAV